MDPLYHPAETVVIKGRLDTSNADLCRIEQAACR